MRDNMKIETEAIRRKKEDKRLAELHSTEYKNRMWAKYKEYESKYGLLDERTTRQRELCNKI